MTDRDDLRMDALADQARTQGRDPGGVEALVERVAALCARYSGETRVSFEMYETEAREAVATVLEWAAEEADADASCEGIAQRIAARLREAAAAARLPQRRGPT